MTIIHKEIRAMEELIKQVLPIAKSVLFAAVAFVAGHL